MLVGDDAITCAIDNLVCLLLTLQLWPSLSVSYAIHNTVTYAALGATYRTHGLDIVYIPGNFLAAILPCWPIIFSI